MTERGLPIVDGAPACPFVAFDDDRDERAASPDHRHRCYAEAQPAPRALAHQEAYCLASAFPVCPTFQDWARREAARSRTDPPREVDSVAALAAAPTSQRNPPRNWAAPPPWALSRGDRSDPGRGQEQLWEEDPEGADEVVTADPEIPRRGRGLSGSYADRVASDGVVPGMGREPEPVEADEADDDEELDRDDEGAAALPALALPPVAAPPPVVAPPERAPEPELASDPDRAALAGPDRDDASPADYGRPDAWDDEISGGPPDQQPRRHRERDPDRVGAFAGGGADVGRQERRAARGDRGGGGGRGSGGGGGERRRDSQAPEWERARPMEAFPTLRSRRLSELSVPPILVGVVALALAAAVLFALPGLLGFGNPSAGGSSSPTTPIRTPIVTAAPTPIPAPTDQLYTVQQGDTMSRIANKFDVELGDLIAANAETIPDPDKLQIGDQVIIPAKNPDELPAASEIPGAT